MISVVIASFGSDHWEQLARDRARPSTEGQEGVTETLMVHMGGGSLAEARNTGAAMAAQPWLLFLDADDELDPGFGSAMVAAIGGSTAEMLYTPAVTYAVGRRRPKPRIWPEIDMRDGNWLVIGTIIPRLLFLRLGGFHEWPIYEDWCLWQRATKAGATVVKVPDAVYVAHTNPRSRNRAPGRAMRLETHHRIRMANYPELYEEEQ